LWRKENPVIVDGQVVKGGMWGYQRRWWQSEKFFKLLVGGYGSGKTQCSAKRAIALSIFNAPSPYLYVSPSYKLARRTIVPHIRSMLDGRQIPYRYNKSDFEFIIETMGRTATIWIGSGDNPDALKGPNICAANIDEPFIQPREVFDQIQARIRDPIARHRELSMTGTPEELNWGYEICEGEEAAKFSGIMEVIRAKTEQNLALPPEYVENLKASYDPLMVKAYLNGEFVNLNGNLIYYGYSDANLKDIEYNPNMPIGVGMDFNVNPMSAVIFQEVEPSVYCAIDEMVLKQSNTRHMCETILEKYPNQVFTVAPDATGANKSTKGTTDFAIIKQVFGGRLDRLIHPPSNPRVKDRFNCVNAAFGTGDGKISLYVSPKCKELIKDFKQITAPFDEYKRKNEKAGRVHTSDAAGYFIFRKLPLASKPTIKIT
jgi:PBSX family phage terminase large subunit